MGKHVTAINVLNDELERVVKNVAYLQTCLGKSKLRAALFPNREAVILSADLRWRRLMKEQLKKGKELEAAIKVLERDI
jgi:hypothetical protein